VELEQLLATLAAVPNLRTARLSDYDLSENGDAIEFEGHAAVYDEPTELNVTGVGTVYEVIERGAFRRILATNPDLPMLYNHDPNAILADTGNGTLYLKEDGRGLYVRAQLDRADPDVGRVVAKIRSGLIRGMSFGFVAGRDNQRIETRGDRPLRRLTGFKKLLDVGPVVGPAYRGTDVALRSALLEHLAADSPELLQQILSGAYQQLEDRAAAPDGTEAEQTPPPDEGEHEEARATRVDGGESAAGGGQDAREMPLYIAKQRLHLMSIELEEGDHFYAE